MNYFNDIKTLIEKDIVLNKKHRLIEEDSRLNIYYEIGRLIVEAQGGEKRAKYGNGLIKEWSNELITDDKSIGIILCKEDNEIVVKYVTDERILFSTYQLN